MYGHLLQLQEKFHDIRYFCDMYEKILDFFKFKQWEF